MELRSRDEERLLQRLKDIHVALKRKSYDEAERELRILIDRVENDDLD